MKAKDILKLFFFIMLFLHFKNHFLKYTSVNFLIFNFISLQYLWF
ncbi:hypothetical protein T296_23385 [Pantoea agglomerans Eh318]|nr:hypothetical protein T296_23385 [Pantoea agglomerans Eh318]